MTNWRKEVITMLSWFTNNHAEGPTRDELIKFAEQYFRKHSYDLTAGTVKGRVGVLSITVSFAVAEEKGGE
jgi:hypothetical protein